MLRVAHLLPNMVVGGRERFVADLCRHAAAWDIAPQLICYDPHAAGARIALDGVPCHAIDRSDAGFASALAVCLARERIDVLHAQGHIAAALAASVARSVPVVTTLHIALGSGWRWLPAIGRGLRASREVVAVSADLARRYRTFAGQPIAVVPPGVDAARFPILARRPDHEPFTIGIAARLHPVKRHRDVLAALRLLAERGVRCRLRIAGEGPLEHELRALADGLDVVFDGAVADMPAWLASLDTVVLASDHEGTPLALLEACASGVPCIATDVGGIAAALGDAVRLVPRRQPRSLAAAIASLADRGAAWQVLRSAAARRAPDLSVAHMLSAYRRAYDEAALAYPRQARIAAA